MIDLPDIGSQDFSYYTEVIDGGFFYMGLGKTDFVFHDPYFNFNDELIPFAAYFWT